ncbi:MAG: hypothetical protein LUD51_02970, partial [Clostridia bacterium]|nr:hypothetical protein [Clostridia bacterium]
MTKESKKGQKIGVLILYVIVLLGLLAGFLLPMDLFTGAETISFNSALCMQIPDALSKVLGTLGISVSWLDGVGAPLAISAEMSLGEIATIDFNAWLTIIYAVVTVVAVICIIPAIVGAVTRHTKQEKAAAKADSAAADAKSAADAAAAAAGYVQDSNSNWKNPFGQYTSKDEDGNPIPMDENAQAFAADADGNLVIPALEENPDEKKAALYNYATAYAAARTATAAAKTADAAAAEALENKKQKRETTYHTAFTLEVIAAVVLLLMCFFTIMYMEYNDGEPCVPVLIALGVVVIIGFIQRCIASGGSGVAKFILFLLAFIAVLVAFFNISLLLEEETAANFEDLLGSAGLAVGVTGAAGFEYLGYFLFGAGTTPALFEEGISATMMVFEIGGIITAVMVLANCLLDMLGIYKSTNKFMLVADQVIYLLEIVGIILMLVPAIIDEEIGVGMMFIVLIVLVVASYIIDLVRLIMRNKKDKAAKAVAEGEAVPEGNTEAPVDAFGNSAAQPAADYAASGYQAAPVDENPFGDLPLIPAEPA